MLLVLRKESLCGLELEQSQTQLQILERLVEMNSAAQNKVHITREFSDIKEITFFPGFCEEQATYYLRLKNFS